MAYDSKTYGQSPFGKLKPDDASKPDSPEPPTIEVTADSVQPLADAFPQIPTTKRPTDPAAAQSIPGASATASSPAATGTRPTSTRKARSPKSKSTAKASPRKSKKPGSSKAATQSETAEQLTDRRFTEEDRRAYLSLLYKTGISGLVWAVLRLSRYELSERAIAIINALIDPLMIATVTFIAVIALTFWTRRLLSDLARHTQKLHADAEMPDAKNFRPTLEIVGDALEFNPKFRKNVAALSNAASIVICSLVSYLITFTLFPTE